MDDSLFHHLDGTAVFVDRHGALNIVGPPLGALLMEVLPLHGVMLVDVGTAMLAIVPLFFVHVPQPTRADKGAAQKLSILADMREGLRYIRGWPGLVTLIGSAMIFKIALTPAFSLLPLLVTEHFNGGAAQLSLLESVAGVGILVGGRSLAINSSRGCCDGGLADVYSQAPGAHSQYLRRIPQAVLDPHPGHVH